MLNTPSLGQVAGHTRTTRAFEETQGKDLALDSCASEGRPGAEVCLWDRPAPREVKTRLVAICARRLNVTKLPAREASGMTTLGSPRPLRLGEDKLTLGDTIKISN